MKKIIILLIGVFLLTGCYDNVELNNLAIVSGVGIDYYNDEYYLTYEILNDIKTDDNTTMKSFTAEGHGKTISEAATDVNYKVGKKPYFAHLKIILFSESVVKDKLDKISDYLLRDANIRDEFMAIVTKDVSPKEILTHNSDNNPVVSDLITKLIENEQYNNNLAVTETFQNIVAKLAGNNYDIVLNSITLNNDEISLDEFCLFNGYKFKSYLDKNNSPLYNLLTKNVFSLEFIKEYEKGNVTINITGSSTDIKVTKDKIKIHAKLEGKILENNPDFDLKNEKTYQKLNKDFDEVITKDITNFIKILQKEKSDILGLSDIYYKNTRKENHNLWLNADIKIDVDLKINTKGFIFEVKNEK